MVSIISSLMIQSKEVETHPYKKGELWGYEIVGDSKAPLFTEKPRYSTKLEASNEGRAFANFIKNLDLSEFVKEKKELSNLVQDS